MFSTNIPELISGAGGVPEKPSAAHSAYESVVEPFYAVGGALGAIPGTMGPEKRQMFKEHLDAIQEDLSNPQIGLAQKGGNWISNIAGGAVATAPAFAAAGAAIEGAVGAGAYALAPIIARPVVNLLRTPIAKLSRSALADWLPQSTIGEFAKHTAAYVGGYKAAVLPEHVMDEYDKISDTYNLKKAGEATLNDNLGMLIGIVPFAAGHILLKSYNIAKSVAAAEGSGSALARELVLNREQKQSALTTAMSNAKTAVDKEHAHSAVLQAHMDIEQHNFKVVQHAVDMGRLPEEEGKWYHDYIKDPDAHEYLAPVAHKILQEEQVPYDRVSGRVWQKLLLPEDIKNHNSTVADAITSDTSPEYKNFMSDYILHNRLDMVKQEWNEKPVLAGGSQGFVDYVNKKMLGKDATLEKLDSHLDKHMTVGLKKNKLPMSQNRIYQHLKKQRMLAPEAPYSVPGRVAHKLELNRKYQRAIRAKQGRYTPEQIEKFKTDAKNFKLLNPAEELDSIRSRLIASPENEYYRGVPDVEDDEGAFFSHDIEFGAGYWFAKSKEHAEFYGEKITKIKGNFKIFDVLKSKDNELLNLYKKIKNSIKEQIKIEKEKKESGDQYAQLDKFAIQPAIQAFREAVEKKGYVGIQRREGYVDRYGARTTRPGKKRESKVEVMFFHAPEELTNPLGNKLVKGFQNKRSYHRLNDLAELYPQAELLLRRIHDEHEYAKQEQNAQLLQKFVKLVDSSIAKLAKPENVVKYLKDRVESQVPDIRNIAPATKIMEATDIKVETINKSTKAIEANPDILVEQEALSKKSQAEDAKQNFKDSKDRLEQFKEREVDLDQLINCLEGTK